jgi:hypothetical protein
MLRAFDMNKSIRWWKTAQTEGYCNTAVKSMCQALWKIADDVARWLSKRPAACVGRVVSMSRTCVSNVHQFVHGKILTV